MTPAMFCNHANEVPGWCSCSEDYYCKEHTCKAREHVDLRTPHPGSFGELLVAYETMKSLSDRALERTEEARLRAASDCVHPYAHCAVFVQSRDGGLTHTEGDYCMICQSRRLIRGHGPWMSRKQWNEFCER